MVVSYIVVRYIVVRYIVVSYIVVNIVSTAASYSFELHHVTSVCACDVTLCARDVTLSASLIMYRLVLCC